MRVQAIQNNTNFRHREVLRAYRDSCLEKSATETNNKSKTIGLINGTLLGVSACGFISAFTDGLKMLVPAVIAGVSAIVINAIRLSKNCSMK